MRHTPEAASWIRLGWWSNNVENNHLSPGPFDGKVAYCGPVWCCSAHTRLIDTTINDALWTVTGRLRPTQADNLPILSGIKRAELRRSGATLSPGRHAIEPEHLFHSALTHPPSAVAWSLKSRHPFVPAAQPLVSFSDNNNKRAALWEDHQWNAEWVHNNTSLRTLIPDTGTPTHPVMTLSRWAWVRLNRLRTVVGGFRSCFYKWGMASYATHECSAEEQTVDHVVLHCPIHRSPHGLHDLTFRDNETTERLLNTCPEISRGQAVDKRTRSNERRLYIHFPFKIKGLLKKELLFFQHNGCSA